MPDIMNIIKSFRGKCSCGRCHSTSIKDIRVGEGLVHSVGHILKENDFPENLLLVCDKNTLAASKGISESLDGFTLHYHVYDNIRVAKYEHVTELEELIQGKDIAILSVGTGSVNDPCRLAAANQNKKLCIFATAPSMDGFASYSSPIVSNGFKLSYSAKSPEVIIADTNILASSPAFLKSAGFGDMMAKYVGLVDWKISHILIGEEYCERVAKLTRDAADKIMSLADRVTSNDKSSAEEIFKALLMTGIGMSFMQNSRPASGSEHVIAHLIECIELRDGIIPNYHGEDVGVCTLEMLKLYSDIAKRDITPHKDDTDLEEVYAFYKEMADDVRKMNTPNTVTDLIPLSRLEEKWDEIRSVIFSVPTYEECEDAMRRAGCKLTLSDIGKSEELFSSCVKYSPYMRRRLTLLRMINML